MARLPSSMYAMLGITILDVSSHVVEVFVWVTGGHSDDTAAEMAEDNEVEVKVPTGTGEEPIWIVAVGV